MGIHLLFMAPKPARRKTQPSESIGTSKKMIVNKLIEEISTQTLDSLIAKRVFVLWPPLVMLNAALSGLSAGILCYAIDSLSLIL